MDALDALVSGRLVPVALALGLAWGCKSEPPPALRAPGMRVEPAPPLAEPIFEAGLSGRWEASGRGVVEAGDGGPARVVLGAGESWILSHPRLRGAWGGLVFRFRASATYGDFLEARVDSDTAEIFPRVQVGPQHRRELEGGWSEVFVPIEELDPQQASFGRIVLRSHRPLPPPGLVELDGVGLSAPDPGRRFKAAGAGGPKVPARFVVDCAAESSPISPMIYGVGFASTEDRGGPAWGMNPTARLLGGPAASRYNWELGMVWNLGAEGFFRNVLVGGSADFSWSTFLEVAQDRGVKTALTVPLLGWVAKDAKSSGFPASDFGRQQKVDEHGAGNGVGVDGQPLKPSTPARTSVPAPPDFIAQWVGAVRRFEQKRGRSVVMYVLDHEPDRWSVTHRDVHPLALTYDELLERTLSYGAAVRKADPSAVIAGPGFSGGGATQVSPADAAAGSGKNPDRLAHDDTPFIEWYLSKLAAHHVKTGVKVIDVLDLHYFPRGDGLGRGPDGKTDPTTSALRIQSVRGLWDVGYQDGSGEPEALIPRMREWVDRNYPGLGLSIGAYGFGAERHLSGGLAVAEALGRFGEERLDSAFYGSTPPQGSPAFHAFRAFRDFDGEGAAFEANSMAHWEDTKDASLFAARSDDLRRVTLVLLNRSDELTLEASVKLTGCPAAERQRVFAYSGDPKGFFENPVPLGSSYLLPPYSMTVVELRLAAGAGSRASPRPGP